MNKLKKKIWNHSCDSDFNLLAVLPIANRYTNCALHAEIKSRLDFGNACSRSLQSLVSSLQSKGTKFGIYKSVLPHVCETQVLRLRG
jgi:hypothetical protein